MTSPGGATSPGDVARGMYAALTARDLDQAVRWWAGDVVQDILPIGQFRGRGALRGFYDEMFAAAPDLVITPEVVLSDDERAVVQWHLYGTFNGTSFRGIRATGRAIELRGVDVMQVTGGTMRHNTVYYDGMAFARQVGLLPGAGTGGDKAIVTALNAKTDLMRRIAAMRQPGPGTTPGTTPGT